MRQRSLIRAMLLAARGAKVLIADRHLDAAERVAKEIGDSALPYAVDVGTPTGQYHLDGWADVIGVNLSGVFYSMRAEIPAILATAGGSIINMASILGTVGFAQSVAFLASGKASNTTGSYFLSDGGYTAQ